jgi:DeoR family transcriptional regulator of aga operon
MLASDRQRRILELLEHKGSLSNTKLAVDLRVSLMTVRRDLSELEQRGLLVRVHGGVQKVVTNDIGYALRSRRAHAAKTRIGVRAAQLIQDGETIYLDAGTTTVEIARALLGRTPRGLRVVTHAVNIAMELSGHSEISLIQVGGEIYRQTYAATGPLALETIARFSFDRMFLACQGFDTEGGLSNGNLTENEVKQAAMRASRWIGLVADASKWTRTTFARIAPLDAIHAIITDNRLPESGRVALQELGLEVIVAGE